MSIVCIYVNFINIYNFNFNFSEEDYLGSYSRVLTKYFLAEGVVCKHDLFIASADENPEEIVSKIIIILLKIRFFFYSVCYNSTKKSANLFTY